MKPEKIGRVLGTGLRVAGKVAGERLAASGQPGAASGQAHAANQAVANHSAGREAGRVARQAGGSVARGVGGFLRPFGRVGGKLWLEVTGVFFLLPVIVFAPNLWRTRASWLQGPDHRVFLVTAVVVVVFLYLGVSSFWRAGRR